MTTRALLFVFFVLQSAIVYVPEAIDHLGWASERYVQVEGIASAFTRDDGVTSFRLLDPHGHYRRCVLPKGMDPPKAGAHVRVKGTRKLYAATMVVEVDPVASLEPIED